MFNDNPRSGCLFIARCVSCFFELEMRHFLLVVIALQCAQLATASTVPLTGKDIVLMLRVGYSTEDVERELEGLVCLVYGRFWQCTSGRR